MSRLRDFYVTYCLCSTPSWHTPGPPNQRFKIRQIMSLVNMADTFDTFQEIPIMYICLNLLKSDRPKSFLQSSKVSVLVTLTLI